MSRIVKIEIDLDADADMSLRSIKDDLKHALEWFNIKKISVKEKEQK